MIVGDISHLLNVNPNKKAPPPDPDLLAKSNLVLIRHGVTDYNTSFASIASQYGSVCEQLRELNSDPRMLDLGLRPEGITQCEFAQQYANQINFKYVLISPLLRTVQTAIHIFKNHPNKKNIKFIVVPLMKEGLDCTYCVNLTQEQLHHQVDPLLREHGLTFDFSMLFMCGIKDLFQISVLNDVAPIKDLYSKFSDKDKHSVYGYNDPVFKKMNEVYPSTIESLQALYYRTQQIKNFIKHFLKNNHLASDEKCAIVNHSDLLQCLTSKGLDPETGCPIDPPPIYNCQLYPWNLEY